MPFNRSVFVECANPEDEGTDFTHASWLVRCDLLHRFVNRE